ncbi:hypothetical protein BH11MYX3_BH11MYX3_02530 [soil metagenome]
MRLALVVAFAAGCQGAAAEQTASDTVHSYFAAITASDCNALSTLSGGKVAANLEKLGCTDLIKGYEELGLELVAINSEVEDGRDRDARIVHAVMKFAGKAPRELLLRVERARGRWVLVSI